VRPGPAARSLEVGKLADLAVLPQDVFSVPVDQIDRTTVTMTMVGGKVVYESDRP
jgi:predicted amidohydrolase YtcJ